MQQRPAPSSSERIRPVTTASTAAPPTSTGIVCLIHAASRSARSALRLGPERPEPTTTRRSRCKANRLGKKPEQTTGNRRHGFCNWACYPSDDTLAETPLEGKEALGGRSMNTIRYRSRFRMCLAICTILCGLAGCSGFTTVGMGPTFTPSSTDIHRQPRRARPRPTEDRSPNRVAPAPSQRETDPEYDMRHPSRWKKKLRAKYA